MKTVVKIEKETDEISIGWFDPETEEWFDFEEMTEDELKAFCVRKDFRELLFVAIKQFCTQVRETVSADFDSIWKRMDALEKALEKIGVAGFK